MKSGELTSGAAKLQRSWEKLLNRWESTKSQWHDSVTHEFENEYLVTLAPQVIATAERMRALAGLLNAAEHECDH